MKHDMLPIMHDSQFFAQENPLKHGDTRQNSLPMTVSDQFPTQIVC